jgi:hypothetical protein
MWHNTTIDGKIGEEIYEDLCKLFWVRRETCAKI